MTDDEIADIANSGPAPYTNKMMMMTMGPIVKLMFMDQAGPQAIPYFRTAVTMSKDDALALKTLLAGLLDEPDWQDRETQGHVSKDEYNMSLKR